jgi:hypothetical protein
LDHGLAINYAWSPEVKGEFESWSLRPWQRRGLKTFDRLDQIPKKHVLVVSHYAPWWSPLKEWIASGRPWIEIDYGYWGLDTPRRATRRVTYCGHHNINMHPRPYSRAGLFPAPAQQEWQQRTGEYVLVPMPINDLLVERRGITTPEWCELIKIEVSKYWDGPIVWRKKAGEKALRFQHFQNQLSRAHAVVGERTMACVEAVLLGIPAYTVDASMTTLLMGGVENLSNIQYPDRTDWWDHIAWSQFHISEFESGTTPADLVELYQIR